MAKTLICFVLTLIFVSGCAQQSQLDQMKTTADNLLSYLLTNDSARILQLHAQYHDSLRHTAAYTEITKRVLHDCKEFQNIVKIYGMPRRDKFIISDGLNDSKDLTINIFAGKDSMLRITYAKIIIKFYPNIIDNPKQIVGYILETGKERPNGEKIKMPPTFQR